MSLYDDLGLDAEASPQDIKTAFRRAAMKHHPDRQGGDAGTMQRVQAAYDVLSDASLRDHYDRTGKTEIPDKRSQIDERMMALFEMALKNQIGDGDVVEKMIELINRTIGQMRHRKIERQRDLDRLTKRSTRVTVTSGQNLYLQLAKQMMAQCESDIAEYDAEIDVQHLILEQLQNYEDAGPGVPEYEFSVPPDAAMP